jgi:hypothetical protein
MESLTAVAGDGARIVTNEKGPPSTRWTLREVGCPLRTGDVGV